MTRRDTHEQAIFGGGCLSIALFISVCAGHRRVNDVMKAAQTDSDKVSALLKDASTARPVVKLYQEQWINPVPIKSVTKAIPEKMRRCHMTYKTSQPQTIYQFAQDVTQQCGLRVKVSPDVADMLSRGTSSRGGQDHIQNRDRGPSPVPPLDNNGMMPLPSVDIQTSRLNSETASMNSTITDVAYSGKVAGLLDMVTARLGISWRVKNEEITLFYLETRRFNIDPTNAKYSLKNHQKSGLSTQSSTGGGGSSSGSSTSQQTEMANDLYGDIQKTAESMLTPGVGRLSLNQTSGVVVVTDVPEVVNRIGEYLRDENIKLSKQVLLKVVVYTVHTETADQLSIDWNVIFKSLSGKYGIHVANDFNAGSNLANGGV